MNKLGLHPLEGLLGVGSIIVDSRVRCGTSMQHIYILMLKRTCIIEHVGCSWCRLSIRMAEESSLSSDLGSILLAHCRRTNFEVCLV